MHTEIVGYYLNTSVQTKKHFYFSPYNPKIIHEQVRMKQYSTKQTSVYVLTQTEGICITI